MIIWTHVEARLRIDGIESSTFYSIRTNVDDYERIHLGKGIYGALIYNHVKDLYHLAEEGCGAILMTGTCSQTIISMIKEDVKLRDMSDVGFQIHNGQRNRGLATQVCLTEFFSRFNRRDFDESS
jgi:hypothetical protein